MFRAITKSKIGIALAILFGLSMFFFRGGTRYSNLFNSDNIVATVSGTPISTTKFNRTMQININQFNQILGKKLSGDEIRNYQIESLALGALINDAVFENEFDQNQFLIDEKVIAKITKKRIPNLYKKNNQIDENELNAFLANQGLKIDDLVDIIKFETRSEQFKESFFNINLHEKITNKISVHEKHKRNIEYVKLNLKDIKLEKNFKNEAKKENENIIDFYNQNIDNYKTNETRDISYLLIDKKNYIEQFKPSSESVEKYYIDNTNLYLNAEKRDFIQFNFKSKNEAESFLQNIQNKEQPEIIKYAKNHNIKYNEFNNLSKTEVFEEIANEIFQLSIGEISNVIKSPLASHIIILNNITPQKQKKLSEVQKMIEQTLLSVELNNFLEDLKNNISQEIINGFSIFEISKSNNLEIVQLKNMEKFNKNNGLNPIEIDIINKGFLINKDFVSDIIKFDLNKSFILNVDNVYLSKPIQYDKIYEKVIEDWLLEKNKDYIKEKYNNNINNKDYINQVANDYNLNIEIIELDKKNTDLPSNLVNQIFINKLNERILFIEDNEIYICKIKNIKMTDNKIDQNKEINLIIDLKTAFGDEIIKNKSINTNDSLISGLLSQY